MTAKEARLGAIASVDNEIREVEAAIAEASQRGELSLRIGYWGKVKSITEATKRYLESNGYHVSKEMRYSYPTGALIISWA